MTDSNEALSHLRKRLHSLEAGGSEIDALDSVSVASSVKEAAQDPNGIQQADQQPSRHRQNSQSSLASGSLPPAPWELQLDDFRGGESPFRTRSPLRDLQFASNSVDVLRRPPVVQKAKAVSLRELYMHQLGSRFNVYRDRLLSNASPKSSKRSLNKRNESNQPEPQRPRKMSISLLYSIEDLCTDSTSVLRDRVAFNRQESSPAHFDVSRIPSRARVSLNRSVSERHARPELPTRRTRTISEGPEAAPSTSVDLFNSRFRLTYTPARSLSIASRGSSTTKGKIDEEVEDEIRVQDQAVVVEDNVVTLCECVSDFFDLSLLQEPIFLLVCVSVMFMAVGTPHAMFFLPSHVLENKLEADAGLILALASIFDLVGRLASGVLIDAKIIRADVYYSAAMLTAAASALLIPTAGGSFVGLTMTAGFFALGSGTWFLLVPLLLSDFLGVDRIGSSYGLVRFFQAWTNLCGPILGGFLWEKTGDIANVFYLMGASMSLAALVSLIIPIWASKRPLINNKA